MTRFFFSFVHKIERNHIIILLLGILLIPNIGCIGGVSLVPLSAKIQNADNTFEQAEAVSTRSDDAKEKQKAEAKQKKLYDSALSMYLEIIANDAKAKYAQRSHYQIGKNIQEVL